jgi:hypothetical protein
MSVFIVTSLRHYRKEWHQESSPSMIKKYFNLLIINVAGKWLLSSLF